MYKKTLQALAVFAMIAASEGLYADYSECYCATGTYTATQGINVVPSGSYGCTPGDDAPCGSICHAMPTPLPGGECKYFESSGSSTTTYVR